MSKSNKKQIYDTLEFMGFEQDYINRAFKVYEKNYGHGYTIPIITEIIVRLQNKDQATYNQKLIVRNRRKRERENNNIPFESHMTIQDALKLNIHDKIDHRDKVGRFVCATIIEKQGDNLKIHYDGWSSKWDTCSDFRLELYRFGKAGSISQRPAHRFQHLKKGDYVDINPTQTNPGWKCAEIRRLDEKSGQVQVVYQSLDKNNKLYWVHLDNIREIARFTSKTGDIHQGQIELEKKIEKNKSKPKKINTKRKADELDLSMPYPKKRRTSTNSLPQKTNKNEMENKLIKIQKQFDEYKSDKLHEIKQYKQQIELFDDMKNELHLTKQKLNEQSILISSLQIVAAGMRDAMLNGHEPRRAYESNKCDDGIERTTIVAKWKKMLNKFSICNEILSEKNENNKLTQTMKKQILKYLKLKNKHNHSFSFTNPMTTLNNIKLNDLLQVTHIVAPHRVPQLVGEKGVFAKMDIAKNTVLAQYAGIEMSNQEWQDTFDYSNRDIINGKYLYSFDIVIDNETKQITIDPLEGGYKELSVLYINDCRKNVFVQEKTNQDKEYLNCKFFEVYMKGWPNVFVITTKLIKKGNEVLADYGNDYWKSIKENNRSDKIAQEIRKISDKNIVRNISLHDMHDGIEAYHIE